ncbi:hypothetical protein, partial [Veronia pacifica]|uniref:hypothetical protein n=2 Tax=Veronia pacifica TaxID=1080227 RepID=UPI000AC1FB0D
VTHTELISRDDGGLTFESIEREPISGLLGLRLKQQRFNSTPRITVLPRHFDEEILRYVNKRAMGTLRLTDPILMSKSGQAILDAGDLNRMVREPFKQIKWIPKEGLTLHAIRDVIAASAIASGANEQYIVRASGRSGSTLARKQVLPI